MTTLKVVISASVARPGIQYSQSVLDTGFRRYDDIDVDIWHYDTVYKSGMTFLPSLPFEMQVWLCKPGNMMVLGDEHR